MAPKEEEEDDNEQERAALERELAAELAALSLGGDDDDNDIDEQALPGPNEADYARLDLDAVLQDVACHYDGDSSDSAQALGGSNDGGVWSTLLASVAFCDTHVFGAFGDELDELQTQILPQLSAVAASVAERGSMAVTVVAADEVTDGIAAGSVVSTAGLVAGHGRDKSPLTATPRDTELASPSVLASATRSDVTRDTVLDERIPEPVVVPAPLAATDLSPWTALEATPSKSAVPCGGASPAGAVCNDLARHDDASPANEPVVASVPSRSPSLPQPRHESLRNRVLQTAQRAQDEMAAWLSAKQNELEAEEKQRETHRRDATRERDARSAMAIEERAMQLYLVTHRTQSECHAMVAEDARCRVVEMALTRAAQCEQRERHSMGSEEARTWRLRRVERETQRREQLVEEQSRVRRSHHRALNELVLVMAMRAEAQDAERRRAFREMSAMRSEEHWMRRVIVSERMVRDTIKRQREHAAMAREDATATAQRRDETKRNEQEREQRERESMDAEHARSRVWETLGRLRRKQLMKWIESESQRRVRYCWREWRRTVDERRQRDVSAAKIQRVTRHWRKRRQCDAEEQAQAQAADERTDQEAAVAARVVQSAFRGFHVRRKFQNALEMAQRMAIRGQSDDEGFEFGEVNFDDWIGAPPELEDDWERPAMPLRRPAKCGEPATTNHAGEEEEEEEDPEHEEEQDDEVEEEEEEDEETVRGETIVTSWQAMPAMQQQHPQERPQQDATPPPAANLAAALWNKMRKRTQKQKIAQEERQKQQDPVYRAQKLLTKTAVAQSGGHHSSSTNPSHPLHQAAPSSIAWATNTDKKKAPKVKLPSLVERLRKKTAAAR